MATKGPKRLDGKESMREYACGEGIKVAITGEDGPTLVFFGGKSKVRVTITSEDGTTTLIFSGVNRSAE